MPAFCIALGFWVVLVRPNDPSAWLLLGLMLSFTQLVSAVPLFAKWGLGVLKLAYSYNLVLKTAWPIFMFLFGFYFPEPLPYFTQPGLWRKWMPWIVVAPYASPDSGFESSWSLRPQTIPLPCHCIAFFIPCWGQSVSTHLSGGGLLQLYLHQIRNEHLPGCKTKQTY